MSVLAVVLCVAVIVAFIHVPPRTTPYKRIDKPRWLGHGQGVRRAR